ncbi:MAG: hypothetical protein IKO26_10235 [Paludibacteraceae bacterium]|nr:hypothetical protein [Paludibacteraceae bacterium]
MKRITLILSAVLLLCLTAQGRGADTPASGRSGGVFTGFSGGMMLHGGYLFSQTPEKVFSNSGLGSLDYIKGLPKDGFCYGLGGTLRVHLLDHIHLGAEGFVSNLPLMKTGSNVRSGWGGAMCDFYTQWGKTRPLIGLTIGGGTMKRLYVPDQDPVKEGTDEDAITYNSSYVKTPFFLLDPYVGLEIDLTDHMALILRIDYLLPIGKTNSSLVDTAKTLKWSSFMTPSGPRLYVGLMFGKFGN